MRFQGFNFSPLFGHLPVMQEITEQLGGGQFFTGGAAHQLSNGPILKKSGQCPRTDTSMRMVLPLAGVPL